jgi:hypothetical protein
MSHLELLYPPLLHHPRAKRQLLSKLAEISEVPQNQKQEAAQ